MDYVFAGFVLICLAFVRPIVKGQNREYLSLDNCNNLRVIMTFVIMFLHFNSVINVGGYVANQLKYVGYLMVAFFFFLSGYGLVIRYLKNGESYIEKFFKKRILFFIVVLAVYNVLYYFVHSLLSKSKEQGNIIENIFNKRWVCFVSWYIVVLILFYSVFFISRKCKLSNFKYIAVLFLFTVLLNVLLMAFSLDGYWYYSNFAFLIGSVWAIKKAQIDIVLEKHYYFALGLSLFAFVGFSVIAYMLSDGIALSVMRMILSIVFSVLAVLIMRKIRFAGTLLGKMSKISLELYLIHVAVYKVLFHFLKTGFPQTVYILVSIAFCIAVAIPLNYLTRKMHLLFS